MNKRLSTAVLAAALLLMGAGCDLGSKISLRWPFSASAPGTTDIDAAALALKTEPGETLTIQPSYLGVTGTIADIFGSEKGLKTATVQAFEPGVRAELAWTEKGDPERKGTVSASAYADAHEMLLPAFWKPEAHSTQGASLIWMSSGAWRELKETGSTEWKLGLGGETSVDAALKAYAAFNALAAKLSGGVSDSSTSTGPFRIQASKRLVAFPLRIDGKIRSVRALEASSWFADYFILENPENPLILKVTVNPVAVKALDALKPLGVDVSALGYEITSMARP